MQGTNRESLEEKGTGSGFRVQGSGGGFAAFLEEGILDTQPSPRGEGAPKGRIG